MIRQLQVQVGDSAGRLHRTLPFMSQHMATVVPCRQQVIRQGPEVSSPLATQLSQRHALLASRLHSLVLLQKTTDTLTALKNYTECAGLYYRRHLDHQKTNPEVRFPKLLILAG